MIQSAQPFGHYPSILIHPQNYLYLLHSGHNYTSTYTTLLNQSKLIEQQAKELDENDPDSRESDNRNNEEA